MAKRKLSESQRTAIRDEIAKSLQAGKSQAETLRAIAKKYSITTVTTRWYLKSLKSSSPTHAVAKKQRAVAPRETGKGGPQAADAQQVFTSVKAAAEEMLSRMRRARKLIPQWPLSVRKERTLRKMVKQVRRALRAAARKANALGRRMKKLTSK